MHLKERKHQALNGPGNLHDAAVDCRLVLPQTMSHSSRYCHHALVTCWLYSQKQANPPTLPGTGVAPGIVPLTAPLYGKATMVPASFNQQAPFASLNVKY